VSKRKKESKSSAKSPSTTGIGQVQPRASVEFAPDYSYVRKDLRRIAIIAGGILAALLVLAVVLS
jgi:hypothetical protein